MRQRTFVIIVWSARAVTKFSLFFAKTGTRSKEPEVDALPLRMAGIVKNREGLVLTILDSHSLGSGMLETDREMTVAGGRRIR